jgi:Eco57I restriction-modification methylase
LNLAARNITNEENYPRIARKNFFLVRRDSPEFCELPKATRTPSGERERERIDLPELDAVVGNPPYVRQELIPKEKEKGIKDQTKEYLLHAAELAFPDLKLSGQSDLHLYFWPVAAQFLREGGWFGFLTSSSWLDVRYGFSLQRWILQNFRLVAVMESTDEPWFEDARVKTAVTIVQRCSDAARRDANLVRFVRFKQPLAQILGEREDEEQKQSAAERLRDLILRTKSDYSTDALRILVKKQSELWQEGVALGEMFAKQKALNAAVADGGNDEPEEEDEVEQASEEGEQVELHEGDYGGGKWGRYLRAPDFYFDIMREFGDKFVRLGEVASIRRGITSGCDAFFMPKNVSGELLTEYSSELEWQTIPLMQRCKRSEVSSGEVVIVRAGDNTLHPLEKQYVRPELHSLMRVTRPVVTAAELDRVVLWVNQPLEKIKDTYAYEYIRWGSKRTFASKKSKAVAVPKRSSCVGREHWYDVSGQEPGAAFWPMTHKYRHIVPSNPERVQCNHRLFDLHPFDLDETLEAAFVAVLNSTLVGFFKHFYGRYAGTEGTLDTEVFETSIIELPNVTKSSLGVCKKLTEALAKLNSRSVTHLVEQSFLDCHAEVEMRALQQQPLTLPIELARQDRRNLDLLVMELLGIAEPNHREKLVERLYAETTLYHRDLRIQDIQAGINRTLSKGARATSQLELALDAWTHLNIELQKPLPKWLEENSSAAKTVELPDGDVRLPARENLFEATTLFLGKKPGHAHVCVSRAEAELLYQVAREGVRGPVSIPAGERECKALSHQLENRLAEGRRAVMRLAEERAGTEKLREQVLETLYRWFIHGKPIQSSASSKTATA